MNPVPVMNLVEIVRGLTGSEQVVVRGHESLYAGARVTDTTATTPSAPVPPSKPNEIQTTPKESGHAGH